jgi:hypothetical protein
MIKSFERKRTLRQPTTATGFGKSAIGQRRNNIVATVGQEFHLKVLGLIVALLFSHNFTTTSLPRWKTK